MEKQQLKAYMRQVYEMEKLLYEQRQVMGRLQNWERRLPAVVHEQAPGTKPNTAATEVFACIFFTLCGTGLGALIGLLVGLFGPPEMGTAAGVGAGVGCVVTLIFCLLSERGGKKERAAQWEEYRNKLEGIREKNAEMDRRRQNQLTVLRENEEAARQNLRQTEKILRDTYDVGVLYPKYRNLAAVSAIYEYLDSGRCDQLEGYEGAYNLFESEERQNRIIGRLDDIISHLEDIKRNQHMLYTAIEEARRQAARIQQSLDGISGRLDTVADNTALAGYNAAVTARNSEFLAWYALLKK